MKTVMNGCEEMEFGQGDDMEALPGHDAWIVGDQPCIVIDWQGFAGYAKRSEATPGLTPAAGPGCQLLTVCHPGAIESGHRRRPSHSPAVLGPGVLMRRGPLCLFGRASRLTANPGVGRRGAIPGATPS